MKKFAFVFAIAIAAGQIAGCNHVRQEDLTAWEGQPVELLDKQPVFLTMRSVHTVTADEQKSGIM